MRKARHAHRIDGKELATMTWLDWHPFGPMALDFTPLPQPLKSCK